MRLVLKKELKRPKAPKLGTMKSVENYLQKLKEVEKRNAEIRAYNKVLTGKAQYAQRAVSGFGKKGTKSTSKKCR